MDGLSHSLFKLRDKIQFACYCGNHRLPIVDEAALGLFVHSSEARVKLLFYLAGQGVDDTDEIGIVVDAVGLVDFALMIDGSLSGVGERQVEFLQGISQRECDIALGERREGQLDIAQDISIVGGLPAIDRVAGEPEIVALTIDDAVGVIEPHACGGGEGKCLDEREAIDAGVDCYAVDEDGLSLLLTDIEQGKWVRGGIARRAEVGIVAVVVAYRREGNLLQLPLVG